MRIQSAENFATAEPARRERGSLVAPDITVRRTGETHYSYSFQFSYEFSTTDDPFIAGHPSDVIIGGIDVIVSQALEVTLIISMGRINKHL